MGMVLEVGKEVVVQDEVNVVRKEVMVGKEVVVEGRAVANIHMKTSFLKTPRVSQYICFTEPPEFRKVRIDWHLLWFFLLHTKVINFF